MDWKCAGKRWRTHLRQHPSIQFPAQVVQKGRAARFETKKNYFIVVSKPYWLSLYAKDSTKVRWTVIGLNEWQCPDKPPTPP